MKKRIINIIGMTMAFLGIKKPIKVKSKSEKRHKANKLFWGNYVIINFRCYDGQKRLMQCGKRIGFQLISQGVAEFVRFKSDLPKNHKKYKGIYNYNR